MAPATTTQSAPKIIKELKACCTPQQLQPWVPNWTTDCTYEPQLWRVSFGPSLVLLTLALVGSVCPLLQAE